MNKYLYYIISLILVSWVLPIPFISKYTNKFKPKSLKPSVILLLGFIGGSMSHDVKESAEYFRSGSWTTVWISRLVYVLTFGLVKY